MPDERGRSPMTALTECCMYRIDEHSQGIRLNVRLAYAPKGRKRRYAANCEWLCILFHGPCFSRKHVAWLVSRFYSF